MSRTYLWFLRLKLFYLLCILITVCSSNLSKRWIKTQVFNFLRTYFLYLSIAKTKKVFLLVQKYGSWCSTNNLIKCWTPMNWKHGSALTLEWAENFLTSLAVVSVSTPLDKCGLYSLKQKFFYTVSTCNVWKQHAEKQLYQKSLKHSVQV